VRRRGTGRRAALRIAVAVAASACAAAVRLEGPLEPGEVLARLGTGDSAVVVLNGGYGSAIALDTTDPRTVYLLTDRGPNVNGPLRNQKLFPVPSFSPRIGRFQSERGKLGLRETIILRAGDGTPLSGLAQPPGPGSTNEEAVSLGGVLLGDGGYDRHGLDAEGLARAPDGSFWISDEYGPYLLHVDPTGREIERVSPFGGPRPLPAVLARRRPNCGMEGLAILPDGVTLAGVMQCPLHNPSRAGDAVAASRATRIVLYDTRTGMSRQYLLLLERPEHSNTDIAALGPRRFLVIERDSRWPGQTGAFKRIHAVDLGRATDVSGDPADPNGLTFGGKTLEEVTAGSEDQRGSLGAQGITVAAKVLVADLVTDLPGWSHDKPEGLAVLNDSTVLVANDDDFGITSSDPGGQILPKINPVTGRRDFNEIRRVRLRWPR
jgi:hypothetical protein